MTHVARVISRPEVVPGFALAGLPAIAVANGEDAAAEIEKLRADPGVGLILIDAALHDALPRDIELRMSRTALPIMVPFPAPDFRAPRVGAEEYIVELLRRAIGYRVRIR